MTINPETLLIFRARETEEQNEKGKKKKTAEKEQELPKGESPKRLAKFLPEKEKEPVIIEPQKGSTQPKRQQTQTPDKEQGEQVEPVRLQEKDTQASESKPLRTSPFGTAPFKMSSDRGRAYIIPESSVYSEEEFSLSTEPDAFHEPPSKIAEKETAAQLKSAYIKTQQQSRDAARNKTCAWHPWREAYAKCGFCNRYFCFQDLVEFNRGYYCLEDIDNASSKFTGSSTSRSSNLWLVSGLLLMASFFVFFYFANAQVLYVLQYIHKVTLPFFIMNINYSYALALIEGIFAALAFVSALLLFVRSPKGFYIGVFVCLGAVILFSYQYTSTATLYLGVVDALIFAAFAALIYSRTDYIIEEVKGPLATLGKHPITWPNEGKF